MTKQPRVSIARVGSGWLATCSCGWERHDARRPAADRAAHEHMKTHGRKEG